MIRKKAANDTVLNKDIIPRINPTRLSFSTIELLCWPSNRFQMPKKPSIKLGIEQKSENVERIIPSKEQMMSGKKEQIIAHIAIPALRLANIYTLCNLSEIMKKIFCNNSCYAMLASPYLKMRNLTKINDRWRNIFLINSLVQGN